MLKSSFYELQAKDSVRNLILMTRSDRIRTPKSKIVTYKSNHWITVIKLHSTLLAPSSPFQALRPEFLSALLEKRTRGLPHEEMLRELGLCSLEKRRFRVFPYLKGIYKDKVSLFTKNHMENTRGNGYELLLGRI